MVDHWRELLYPLGWLSGIAFSARFILQWIGSERVGKSIVTPLFWKISLFGNLILFTHAFLQLQYHICFVQVCNAVISWRNLDLMKQSGKQPFLNVLLLFGVSLTAMTTIFYLQVALSNDPTIGWFRIPSAALRQDITQAPSTLWHVLGTLGLLLFNSRFWVQWWQSESLGRSYLGLPFWWISFFGAILCITYFSRIGDWVNVVGPLFGIVPTIRNLMIIKNEQRNSDWKESKTL